MEFGGPFAVPSRLTDSQEGYICSKIIHLVIISLISQSLCLSALEDGLPWYLVFLAPFEGLYVHRVVMLAFISPIMVMLVPSLAMDRAIWRYR